MRGIVSGFVALTLTPMMCSKVLKEHENHNLLYRALEAIFDFVTNGYRLLLRAALAMRPMIVALTIVVAGAAWLIFSAMQKELSPIEDRGVIQAFGVAPEGSTIDFVARYACAAEAIYAKIPEVRSSLPVVAGFRR